jgi:hypothetical protein
MSVAQFYLRKAASAVFARIIDVVLRQEHKAGEKLFVDWAGQMIPVRDDSKKTLAKEPQ